MVKPALPYLDVVRAREGRRPAARRRVPRQRRVRDGEGGGRNGWLDERRSVLEILTSIRRAGADMILTYHAKDAADWLADR